MGLREGQWHRVGAQELLFCWGGRGEEEKEEMAQVCTAHAGIL